MLAYWKELEDRLSFSDATQIWGILLFFFLNSIHLIFHMTAVLCLKYLVGERKRCPLLLLAKSEKVCLLVKLLFYIPINVSEAIVWQYTVCSCHYSQVKLKVRQEELQGMCAEKMRMHSKVEKPFFLLCYYKTSQWNIGQQQRAQSLWSWILGLQVEPKFDSQIEPALVK